MLSKQCFINENEQREENVWREGNIANIAIKLKLIHEVDKSWSLCIDEFVTNYPKQLTEQNNFTSCGAKR